jgi:hypothetical protein
MRKFFTIELISKVAFHEESIVLQVLPPGSERNTKVLNSNNNGLSASGVVGVHGFSHVSGDRLLKLPPYCPGAALRKPPKLTSLPPFLEHGQPVDIVFFNKKLSHSSFFIFHFSLTEAAGRALR